MSKYDTSNHPVSDVVVFNLFLYVTIVVVVVVINLFLYVIIVIVVVVNQTHILDHVYNPNLPLQWD